VNNLYKFGKWLSVFKNPIHVDVDGLILRASLSIKWLQFKYFIKYNLICVTLLLTLHKYTVDATKNSHESTVSRFAEFVQNIQLPYLPPFFHAPRFE